MDYDEFQRHLGKAGLKVYEFARLMEMNPTSISNKRAVGVPRHLAVIAVLLGEMVDNGIDYRRAFERLETTPKNHEEQT